MFFWTFHEIRFLRCLSPSPNIHNEKIRSKIPLSKLSYNNLIVGTQLSKTATVHPKLSKGTNAKLFFFFFLRYRNKQFSFNYYGIFYKNRKTKTMHAQSWWKNTMHYITLNVVFCHTRILVTLVTSSFSLWD